MSTQVHPRVAGRVGATLTLMGVLAVNVLATLLLPGPSTDTNKRRRSKCRQRKCVSLTLLTRSWMVLRRVKAAQNRLGRISKLVA